MECVFVCVSFNTCGLNMPAVTIHFDQWCCEISRQWNAWVIVRVKCVKDTSLNWRIPIELWYRDVMWFLIPVYPLYEQKPSIAFYFRNMRKREMAICFFLFFFCTIQSPHTWQLLSYFVHTVSTETYGTTGTCKKCWPVKQFSSLTAWLKINF